MNAEESNHLIGRLKTWKVDFLHAPSRKLLPGLAAPLTEHVQAELRMLCRAPVRFLLRDPRCLLAQPELSVAEPSSLSSPGLVVASEAPRPSFPLHPLGSAAFPRNSRHEREAAGVVAASVAEAAAAAASPARGCPRPVSGLRLLPARPGARQLLRRRKKE